MANKEYGINIKKIINDKLDEMIKNKDIENTISEKIEETIKAVLISKLTGYSFQNQVEKKLSEQIDPILNQIDFAGYVKVFENRMSKILLSIVDKDTIEKTEKIQRDLFGLKKEPIKLSKIFEEIREGYLPEDDCYNDENYFPLYFGKNEQYSWYEIGFQKYSLSNYSDKNSPSNYRNRITLAKINNSDNYYILSITIDGAGYDIEKKVLSRIGYLSKIERLLLNAHINEREIIMDVTYKDEVDNSLFEE